MQSEGAPLRVAPPVSGCWCRFSLDSRREVFSLTLTYLRVVTGCVDGKVRVFNFLTGDCLRVIEVETESHQILSVHFNDSRWVFTSCSSEVSGPSETLPTSISPALFCSSIIANTVLCVKHLQFSKVFWDYPGADDKISEMSPSSVGELPSSSTHVDRMSSWNSDRKSERAKPTQPPRSPFSKYRAQGKPQARDCSFIVLHF